MPGLLSWLRDFWKATNPGPTDPILWHCRPLLICDATDKVVFKAHEIDVEFTPDGKTPQGGTARIVDWDGPLPVPELTVRSMDIRGMAVTFSGAVSPLSGGREGAILYGRYNDEPFVWYTDGRADEYAFDSGEAPPSE